MVQLCTLVAEFRHFVLLILYKTEGTNICGTMQS